MKTLAGVVLALFAVQGASSPVPQAAKPRGETDGVHSSVINVFHVRSKDGVQCATYNAGDPCADAGHWDVQLRTHEYSLETIGAGLTDEAGLDPESVAGRGTRRRLIVNADRAAPYGIVQRVIDAARAAGFTAIRVGIGGSELDALKEIRIALHWNAQTKSAVRRVGTLTVKDDAELRAALKVRLASADRNRVTRPKVLIDATKDLPWAEVVAVVDACRDEGLEEVDFATAEK